MEDNQKIGAAISAANHSKIQAAHDALSELGAKCELRDIGKSADNALKAISKTDDELRAGNYIILFGGRDLTGHAIGQNADGSSGEYFSAHTNLESDYTKSGVLHVDFEHGQDPDRVGADEHAVLGYVDWKTAKVDERGVFVERVLKRRSQYMQWLETLIEDGLVGNSSEAIRGQVKKSANGEILEWPLKRDSLTVNPMEPRMMSENAVTALKALKSLIPTPQAEAAETAPIAVDVTKSLDVSKEPDMADIVFTTEELAAMKESMANMQAAVADVAKSVNEIKRAQPASVTAGAVQVVTDAADQPFKTLGDFCMAVKDQVQYGRTDIRLTGRKAITGMGEQVPADGGYLVPTTFASGILERMYNTGQLLSRVAKDPISGNSNGMTYNGIDETFRVAGSRWGGIRGYWLAEGGTKTASAPKFRQVELKLKKVAALAYATDELLQDTNTLESWLMRTVPQELAFQVEDAFYEGDGVGKPLGIMNSPALVSPFRADAAKIQVADILKMWASRWTGVNDYVWLINQDVMPQLQQLGNSYQYVWLPPNQMYSGTPFSTLMGKPVIEIEYASTLGTTGDIMLASLSQYQAIDKGGVQAASSIHVAFTTDQSVFRFVYRVDGAPMWHSALTPFKGSQTQSPFVVLATASA